MTEFNFSTLIRAEGIRKNYRTGKVITEALKGIDVNIRRGEYVGIMGKSGSGKTTLLNMLAGLDSLTSGSVLIGRTDIHGMNENERARWRGENLGFIFQSFHLLPGLTLLDNVMLPLDFIGKYEEKKSRDAAMMLLEMVELEAHVNKYPSEISGGQQQRVAIARALISEPQILLADEPTGRLDAGTSEIIFNLFDQIFANGMTMIIVTHDNSLEKRFQRVIRLHDGLIVSDEKAGDA
jgi:putative ABC transport system ATP-binding protein